MTADCTDLRTHLVDPGGLLTGTCPYCGDPVLAYKGDGESFHVEEVRLRL